MLVADPEVILLDDPAGGVNLSLVNHIAARIRELNAAGKTFLIVEHNMEFVMGLCDQVTVLDSGSVVAAGRPTSRASAGCSAPRQDGWLRPPIARSCSTTCARTPRGSSTSASSSSLTWRSVPTTAV